MSIPLPQVRACRTCRHAYTHERCGGCLDGQHYSAFTYPHWEAGDPAADLFAAELAGRRAVVISGEADVLASEGWEATAQRLHRVACACGYIVTWASVNPLERSIRVSTWDGRWCLYYNGDALQRVRRVLSDGTEYDQWNRCGVLDPEKAQGGAA